VSSPVIRALAQSHINEVAQHEADLAARVYKNIGRPTVTDAVVPAVFQEFCAKWKVPCLPARPTTCAGFAIQYRGLDAAELVEIMAGISRAHQAANFADPTASFECNVVLARFVKIEPPRSWTKEDRVEFLALPATVQKIVLRREEERDAGQQRALQKLADERKLLENVRQTIETKPESKTEEKTNAKNETASA
jgi:hypothetical protein